MNWWLIAALALLSAPEPFVVHERAEAFEQAVRMPPRLDRQPTTVIEPRLVIDALGLDEPIVKGLQPEIDAGFAVLVDWVATPVPCWPDERPPQRCVTFIAGHRSTRGSVFNGIEQLPHGATILLRRNGIEYRYNVTAVHVVSRHTIDISPGRIRSPVGGIMLQTSLNDDYVYWVMAE